MTSKIKRKYADEQSYSILFDWVISKEKLLQESYFGSQSFDVANLPNVQYYLNINLKRVVNSVEGTWVFLFLKMPTGMSINVNAEISCKMEDFAEKWTYKYISDGRGYGSKLCLSTELFDPEKKFIADEKFVISFQASLKVEKDVPVPPKIVKGESLVWQLWNNEEDKDAIIVVNGMEIKAHKCVLKRRSIKFDSFFKVKSEPSTKKSKSDKIVVKNHTYDTVKEAIMFCYDIQSSEILSAEEAIDLMKFAEEYQINDLKVPIQNRCIIWCFFDVARNFTNLEVIENQELSSYSRNFLRNQKNQQMIHLHLHILQKNMEEFCIENLSVSNVCLFSNASISEEADKLYWKCFDFLLKCMKDGTAVNDIEKLDEDMQKELFQQAFTKVYQS